MTPKARAAAVARANAAYLYLSRRPLIAIAAYSAVFVVGIAALIYHCAF